MTGLDSEMILSARGIEFAYAPGLEALRGIDLEIRRGEKVALLGPNGAGKSTLLLTLNGCLVPSGGSLEILGNIIFPRSTKALGEALDFARRSVGLLFQEPDDQLFMATVEEDIRCGPAAMGFSDLEVSSLVAMAAETAGVCHLLERPPQNLSGGEKKSAALAAVLAMNPALLVLDEPTDRLDPGARLRLLETLRSMDRPLLMATHDLWAAIELCDRAIIMAHGRVIAEGPTEKLLFDTTILTEAGLVPPPGAGLCRSCGGLLK